MGRKSKRRQQRESFLDYARFVIEEKKKEPFCAQTHLHTLQFVYSVIIHGSTYTDASVLFLENGFLPPAHTTFYKYIDIILDQIILLCTETVKQFRLSMKTGTIISLDGSWDHKRRGRSCIVVIIDQLQKKIIDFEIIRKSSKSYPTDYNGSSQGMETECVRRISLRLKYDNRIIGYCHDRDSSVTSFMKKNWPITEYIDRNHSVKCLATYFKKLENVCGK